MANKQNQNAAKKDGMQKLIIGMIVAAAAVVIATVVVAISLISMSISESKNHKPADTKPSETKPATEAATEKLEPHMETIQKEIDSMKVSDFSETDEESEYVKITVKGHGDIVVRLRADMAPITAKNFQDHVKKKTYDGLTIHRVMKGFMIQGGDPDGNGSGGAGTPIDGEFKENGFINDLAHIKGVISMARRGNDMNSATSQFFICNADARKSLDGKYAAFGYVVAGLDVVDSISDVAVKDNGAGEKSKPVETIVIEKVCFVTKG